MSTGVWVLLIALGAATAFGLVRRARDGRFRAESARAVPPTPKPAAPAVPPTLTAEELSAPLGERGTLVQFSTAFCAPCRATRQVLGDVAGRTDGVTHVEVDAEQHLELVRRLGILRTPTTLVLDAAGVEVTRASGAPTRAAVLATLHHRLGLDPVEAP